VTRSIVERTKRLEFSKKVRLEIFLRAGGMTKLHCEGEGCGLPIKGSNFEIDHTIEEWEREDVENGYRDPLTAEDGKLLCIPCHDAKSGKKSGERAHCKAIVEKAAGARKSRSPLPGSRASGIRKRMNGNVENW
jgi:hypothetical protein